MKSTTLSIAFLTALGLVLSPVQAMAGTANNTHGYTVLQDQVAPVNLTKIQFGKLKQKQQQHVANIWGITPADYQQYLWDMHNTPDGKWYKQLDPAEVLLINAKTEMQRMHYARIVVKDTFNRGASELKAQAAIYKAWHELYPHTPRVRIPHLSTMARPAPTLYAGDIIVLFTTTSNTVGDSTLQTLIDVIKNQTGVRLKIYLENNPSNTAIQTWANKEKIPVKLFESSVISMQIDHNNNYFNQLTHKSGTVPFVALYQNDKLKPVAIDTLWMWGM